MKKLTIQLAIIFSATTLFAQWIPINNGLDGFPPTAILPSEDAVILGTYGGGIYLTYDQGDSWNSFNGDLGNLYVNDVRSHISMLVATDGGPFATYDGVNYFDCTGTGLTNAEINFFTFGNEGITGECMVGTKGGGLFAGDLTSPWILDWTDASAGLTGNALIVNDGIGQYAGFAMIATNGGVYRAMPGETEWTPINTGLSGDALLVKRFSGLGTSVLIATHGGLYYTSDLGENWIPAIADEKLNTVFLHECDIYPNEMVMYAFGEKGFYTEDFITWTQMNFEGIEGEVTAAQADSTNLYLGFTILGKEKSSGVYRKPLTQIITGIKNQLTSTGVVLQQNYPNPCNATTKIAYILNNPGIVCLKVYDVFGKEIQMLVNEFQSSGTYAFPFDVSNLDTGIYFYKLKIGNDFVESKRMIIIH